MSDRQVQREPADIPSWESFAHASTYERHLIAAKWRTLPGGTRVDERVAQFLREERGLQSDCVSDLKTYGPDGWSGQQ